MHCRRRDAERAKEVEKAFSFVVFVGVADPVFGEQVRAVVALKKGETATKEEILKFCDERLADYKIPKYVEIWAQLPKGPTDKILKRAIREIPLKANP